VYINFKELAARLEIEQVASELALHLKKSARELRGPCPVCNTDDDRALAIMPDTQSFRCYATRQSGDVIALYAHIKGLRMYQAAKELSAQFPTANAAARSTPPKKPEGRKQPTPNFDPKAFVERLAYTDEVAALGMTEEDAKRYRIGEHRKKLYLPICPPDVAPSAWAELSQGKLKLPSAWLNTNVVRFKQRA